VTGRLSHIGSEWQWRLKRFFDQPLGPDATPLELREAVLDDIERKAEPLGRGRKIFPYNRVLVRLAQTSADRPALEAAFSELDERLRERLEEIRCDTPEDLDVKVSVLDGETAEWIDGQMFSVNCQRCTEPKTDGREAPRRSLLRVAIVKGAASQTSYRFTEPTISIGRTAEPIDASGRIRRNHVAFLDETDGTTETVGRAHAQLRFDANAAECRLFDEGSSNGTCIIRGGATIPVPPRDPRGVRVQSGDDIQLGRAVIRLSIGDE
jgi:hypothetical protein